MAAPSGIKWGSVVGSGTKEACLGIYVDLTTTDTQVERKVEVWYWTRYAVSDSGNTFYYDAGVDVTEAKTSKGSVTINHTSNTSWSTSNQTKLATYTTTHTRGTSAKTYKVYAKLTGIDYVGVAAPANTSYTVPALESYTVSYNANGGSGAPSNQTKYYSVSLTLSSTKPTRSGYTFMGWSLNEISEDVYYEAGSTCYRNEDVALYAVWKKTITLTYNANGGSGAPSSQSATVYNATTNYKFTISGTKPTRTGHTFLGWSKSSSATSSSYSPSGTITLSESDILYAVWKLNTYTLSFSGNGGTGVPSAQTKTYGVDLTLSSTIPTRTGYTFLGWSPSSTATSASWGAGSSYTANGSITLYAVWKINQYYLDLNGYVDGKDVGTINGTADVYVNGILSKSGVNDYYTQHDYNSSYEIKNIKPNTGYTYDGVRSGSLSGKIGASTTAVRLEFNIKKYSIVYNMNGGLGSIETQTKTHGSNINLSTNVPTRSNYKFLGWGVSPEDKVAKYKPGDVFTVNNNTTLYAVWERLGIAHINVNGTWKKGRIYINDNGTWKTGLIFKNVNGDWKQGGV